MATEPTDAQEQAQGEQQEMDYSGETLEQLEARLMAGEGIVTERGPDLIDPLAEKSQEEEATPEPTEEPEPATEEAEQQAEPEDGEEVTEEVPASEDEPTVEQLRVQEMELRMEQMKRDRDKFELLQGAQAGRAGHLEKQISELKQLLVQQQQQPQQDDYAEPPQRPVVPQAPLESQLQSTVTELQQEAKARAIEQEYNSFIQQNSDAEGLMEKMAPSIREQYEQYKDVQLGTQATRKLLRMILDTAYAGIKLQEVREAREAALQKRVSQVPEKRKAKQVASVSGSGSTPAPRTTVKRPEDMTAEEADAALIREYGDGVYRRKGR